MSYLLDFDRTLFDTDAYNRSLLDEPACAPFRDELATMLDQPYSALGSRDPARLAVWEKVSEAFSTGALSFSPGQLAAYVYADVPEFLRQAGNDAIILTFGEPVRQHAKIESALSGVPRLTVFYTGDLLKADFLKGQGGYFGSRPVFVDDRPEELLHVQEAFPQFALYEMRRDGKEGDGAWPVLHSLSNLPVY
jgi:hypothetical protein